MDWKILLILAVAVLLGIYAYWDKRRRMVAKVGKRPRGEVKEADINLEAVSEAMGLFKHGKMQVDVKNANTTKPVIKAVVGLGNRIMETDEEGMVVFEDVPRGSYEVMVKRDFYNATRKKIDFQEEERIQINLTPTSGLGETEIERLKNALERVRNSYLAVPASDPCLPIYYKSIGEKVINFVEKLSDIPTVSKNINYNEVVEELIIAAEFICGELGEIISDWKNVKIYERGTGEEGECATPDFRGLPEFEEALQDSGKFVETHLPKTRRRLHSIDDEITGRIKEITIMPISGVWRISEGLLSMTETESEEGPTNQFKTAILLLFADAMLDYVEKMLSSEKILERLRVSII